MKIAVTGGAGFIGSHLCEKLSEEHEVLAIDNLSSGLKSNLPEKEELVEHDVKEEEGLEEIFENVDTVFHLAANPKVNTFPEDREKDFNENLKGTHNVLEAAEASNVEEIIFASSSVVYGEMQRYQLLKTLFSIQYQCTVRQNPGESICVKSTARRST